MSKHQVFNDIIRLSVEELQELYGIEIHSNGRVHDLTEMRYFDTLEDWADFIAIQEQEDNYGKFTKIGGRHAFDDEY